MKFRLCSNNRGLRGGHTIGTYPKQVIWQHKSPCRWIIDDTGTTDILAVCSCNAGINAATSYNDKVQVYANSQAIVKPSKAIPGTIDFFMSPVIIEISECE